jgi:hypothetical protein
MIDPNRCLLQQVFELKQLLIDLTTKQEALKDIHFDLTNPMNNVDKLIIKERGAFNCDLIDESFGVIFPSVFIIGMALNCVKPTVASF